MNSKERMESKDQKFTNVYVQNFGNSFDDEKLKELFAGYTGILSAKVMTDDGKSKGFGFVSFEDPETAKQVIYGSNIYIVWFV